MRRVALSQRRDLTGPPHNETRDALDVRLAGFVLAAGGLPVPVPSALGPEDLDLWLTTLGIDAVLLAGGGDIGTDPVRDGLETALVAFATDRALPLLGICRGMQMMAHLGGIEPVSIPGHVATRHGVTGVITTNVNSFHVLAVPACPTGYNPLATAPDGTIEAMRHDTLPHEGWMWHPERDTPFPATDVARFKELLA